MPEAYGKIIPRKTSQDEILMCILWFPHCPSCRVIISRGIFEQINMYNYKHWWLLSIYCLTNKINKFHCNWNPADILFVYISCSLAGGTALPTKTKTKMKAIVSRFSTNSRSNKSKQTFIFHRISNSSKSDSKNNKLLTNDSDKLTVTNDCMQHVC